MKEDSGETALSCSMLKISSCFCHKRFSRSSVRKVELGGPCQFVELNTAPRACLLSSNYEGVQLYEHQAPWVLHGNQHTRIHKPPFEEATREILEMFVLHNCAHILDCVSADCVHRASIASICLNLRK